MTVRTRKRGSKRSYSDAHHDLKGSSDMPGTDHSGRVALITGGARGQGRAHALALAAAGADLVLVDAPAGITTTPYPLATQEDLEETAKAVEASGGKALTVMADVRSSSAMHDAVAQALDRF